MLYQRQRPNRGAGFDEVASAAVEPDGSFAFTPPPFTHTSTFVVRAEAAHPARTVVRVAPAITLHLPPGAASLITRGPARSGHSGRITFTGAVSPAAADARVALQCDYAEAGEGWRTVAFGRVGSDGSFALAHRFRIPGQVNVRVVVHPRGEVAAASEQLALEIVQAQNPQLTIGSSADPVQWGGAVTISGMAAGGGGQKVTLLSRVPGHHWAAAASSTTDGDGSYTFLTAPVQRTVYRVRTAAAESMPLFEDVQYPQP